jgi:hypothetical protein
MLVSIGFKSKSNVILYIGPMVVLLLLLLLSLFNCKLKVIYQQFTFSYSVKSLVINLANRIFSLQNHQHNSDIGMDVTKKRKRETNDISSGVKKNMSTINVNGVLNESVSVSTPNKPFLIPQSQQQQQQQLGLYAPWKRCFENSAERVFFIIQSIDSNIKENQVSLDGCLQLNLSNVHRYPFSKDDILHVNDKSFIDDFETLMSDQMNVGDGELGNLVVESTMPNFEFEFLNSPRSDDDFFNSVDTRNVDVTIEQQQQQQQQQQYDSLIQPAGDSGALLLDISVNPISPKFDEKTCVDHDEFLKLHEIVCSSIRNDKNDTILLSYIGIVMSKQKEYGLSVGMTDNFNCAPAINLFKIFNYIRNVVIRFVSEDKRLCDHPITQFIFEMYTSTFSCSEVDKLNDSDGFGKLKTLYDGMPSTMKKNSYFVALYMYVCSEQYMLTSYFENNGACTWLHEYIYNLSTFMLNLNESTLELLKCSYGCGGDAGDHNGTIDVHCQIISSIVYGASRCGDAVGEQEAFWGVETKEMMYFLELESIGSHDKDVKVDNTKSLPVIAMIHKSHSFIYNFILNHQNFDVFDNCIELFLSLYDVEPYTRENWVCKLNVILDENPRLKENNLFMFLVKYVTFEFYAYYSHVCGSSGSICETVSTYKDIEYDMNAFVNRFK